MTTHDLKCWPDAFDAMERGDKVHEFRKDDRGFAVGDRLRLRRFDPTSGEFTGAELVRVVTYVGTGYGIPDGYVCMSVRPEVEAPVVLPAHIRPGHDALWEWFGMSRASWCTLPRCMMHEMPDEWQAKMAALLMEWNEAFPDERGELPYTFTVCAKHEGKFARVPDWLNNYRHPNRAQINYLRQRLPAPSESTRKNDAP